MRIIRNTPRLLTLRDENNSSSALVWLLFAVVAVVISLIALTDPSLSRPAQAVALVAAGAVLAAGILLGAWLTKVIVVTLNQPEESITIVQGNWLRVRSFEVRPLSEVVHPMLITHEEDVPREGRIDISTVDPMNGRGTNQSGNYSSLKGPITYRSYGLKLIMRSDSDISLSARYGSWEEMQDCYNAIVEFLSPFRNLHPEAEMPDEETLKKRVM